MDEREKTWNLPEDRWTALVDAVRGKRDPLEDGAMAMAENSPATENEEIVFFATALNRPKGWPYAFLESIPTTQRPVASIGRARYDDATGFVHFDVELYAAARALAADYEGGAGDFDDVGYELALEQAVRGRSEDEEWLKEEFDRLVRLTH